ncbi:hypothetical protein [Burkholderia ubonensis]|uniref:hypothetical protein n=1 Tax=Burkholderia ubonensis TaxID=101571 RepID=UPI0007526E44|nr:hypothetical protein [Burkholderia ubonensis]KVT68878.1 hypothetical protein WK54_27015 [Burkholderia ubonensis]
MTTESKKSPAPEQASEAVPRRPRTENPTAEAIFEQAAGAGNLISSKSGDGKSRDDALTDDQRQALGESISEYFGKLDSDEGIRAPEGRILRAFDYCDSRNVDDLIDRAIVPALAASPVEQPAAAPAVVTELASMTRMFHAACHDLGLINEALGLDPDDGGAAPILDAIAELKGRATSANETGAEVATDLRERARLAADQWANPGTSIPQRTAYRDGFIDGASSPTIAAQAVAAWLHRDDPRDCISDAKKRDMIEHAGSGGRRLAENYSIGLCRLDALPAMAAAAPADERATWSNARDSLAVAMAGFAGRSGNRDFNAAIGVLDAITEPGLPLAWLRTARAAASPAAEDDNSITLDRRDLFDFVRGAIKSTLQDYKAGEGMTPSWYWQEATNRTEAVLEALDTKSPYIEAAPQPAQADAPDTIPDECAASGASCSYAPEGRHGEMQCRYCGKAQAGAPAEAREQPKSLAEVWDSALEQIKTDPALLARLRAAIDSDPADARSGDAIARSKRILALVDDYHEKPTSDNRTSLRKALMAEFETAPPTAKVASLTDEQRKAIRLAITLTGPKHPVVVHLRALLNGADHEQ